MTQLALALLAASAAHHLPPGMLSAVCYVESHHANGAIHIKDGKGDSLGACQIKLATARSLGYKGSKGALRYHASTNTFWAAKYLSKQLKRYKGSVRMATAAYNAGTCNQDKKGKIRNSKYVYKVFIAWAEGR